MKAQEEVVYFNRLSALENLTSQTFNNYVFKDSKGYVWISSINGLNRFDGRRVNQFLSEPNDSFKLKNDQVISPFFEDPEEAIWFSTGYAIHRYNFKTNAFRRFYPQKPGHEASVEFYLLHLDTTKNELWVRVGNQLSIFQINTGKTLPVTGSCSLNFNSRIEKIPGSADLLLFTPGDSNYLFRRFRDGTKAHFPVMAGIPGFEAETYFLESPSRCWIGGNQGLIFSDFSSGEVIPVPVKDFNGLPVRQIKGIVPWGERRLLVATGTGGLFILDTRKKAISGRLLSNDNGEVGPFPYPIDKIYLDPDRTLWISSPGNGLFYTNPAKKKFPAFLQNTGKPDKLNIVRSISEDSHDRLWCLTEDGVVVLDKSGNLLPGFEFHGEKSPIKDLTPYYIFCDRSDRVWICTHAGLQVLSSPGQRFKEVEFENAPKKKSVLFINQLEDGRLFASTQTEGLKEVRIKKGKFFLCASAKPAKNKGTFTWTYEGKRGFLFLFEDNPSQIWVYQRKEGEIYLKKRIPFPSMVTGVSADLHKPVIWISSFSGLFRLDLRQNSFRLTAVRNFPQNFLNGLLTDNNNSLWVSTNLGLIRYDPETKNSRIFTLADGLQAQEFNFWSSLRTRRGDLVFGGINGLNLFRPENIGALPLTARPVISEILINDAEPAPALEYQKRGVTNISEIKEICLRYKHNTISFYLAQREYSSPKDCRFRYQMMGQDKDTVDGGTQGFVRYSNLDPGYYTFQYAATNSDGEWSDSEQLSITVLPPWWRTTWFYALMVILVLIILYIVYRSRIAIVKRRERALRQEAEFKQRLAEFETAVLRLQMNPHFIFNSLNSISSYLLTRDALTANDYLGRFARLMRMILKYAERPFLLLSEEMELLEQYLLTEKMRLEKRFSFRFDVDDGLDPDEYEVPTMILQPFVENAIWHGVSHKKEGEGMIRIGFREEKGILICTVEDNGPGREAAKKLKPEVDKHESKAISITQRRLKLLENQKGKPASLAITDLVDNAGQASGTRVTLQLPY